MILELTADLPYSPAGATFFGFMGVAISLAFASKPAKSLFCPMRLSLRGDLLSRGRPDGLPILGEGCEAAQDSSRFSEPAKEA